MGLDFGIGFFDLGRERFIRTLATNAARNMQVGSLAFNHDGTMLLSGTLSGNLQVWDLTAKNPASSQTLLKDSDEFDATKLTGENAIAYALETLEGQISINNPGMEWTDQQRCVRLLEASALTAEQVVRVFEIVQAQRVKDTYLVMLIVGILKMNKSFLSDDQNAVVQNILPSQRPSPAARVALSPEILWLMTVTFIGRIATPIHPDGSCNNVEAGAEWPPSNCGGRN